MLVTILGCGSSPGVPFIQCKCKVCKSRNPRNKRLRPSIWIQDKSKSILVDTSPDFRQQALTANIPRIDAILYTHPHSDHTGGIDDVRNYNFIQGKKIKAYGNRWTKVELEKRFSYIMRPPKIKEGGGTPQIEFTLLKAGQRKNIQGISVLALELKHGSKKTFAYRIKDFAYVIDCHEIPPNSIKLLKNLDTLILDCLRVRPHSTHLYLKKSLEIIDILKPKKAVLTHMNHEMEYSYWSKKLPQNVYMAYDGLKLKV